MPGQEIEVTAAFLSEPLKGVYTGLDRNFLCLKLADGRRQLVAAGQIQTVTWKPRAAAAPQPETPALPPLRDEYPDAEVIRPAVEGPQLKVVGRVDLDRRGVGAPAAAMTGDPLLDTPLKSTGCLKSIGNVYGYIRRDDSDDDLFFYTNQLRYDEGEAPVRVGDRLAFTLGQNKKGAVAYTIHRPGTIGSTLDMMARLDPMSQYMDIGNLQKQIMASTDDAQRVAELMTDRLMRRPGREGDARAYGHAQRSARYEAVDVDDVLSRIVSEEEALDTRLIQDAERKAFAESAPADYQKTANALLEYAIRNNDKPYYPGLIYQLFTRIIKNLGTEEGTTYVDLACDYYERRGEERPASYFHALKEKMSQPQE